MPRDPHRLETFRLADSLVLRIYPLTGGLPSEERYGLQTQIRRAAISVPSNIVEGSQRTGRRDYMRFVEVAAGSAAEAGYLVGLARRLGYLDASQAFAIETDYAHLVRGLERLRQAIGRPSGLRPET
jgi:four helix bundle protein